MSEHDTPVMRLFREWEKARDIADNLPRGLSDEESAPYMEAEQEIWRTLYDCPPQNARDVVAKLYARTHGGALVHGDSNNCTNWAEARQLLS